MICTVDGTTWRGRAVTLPDSVDAGCVARAVREGTASDGAVRVQARRPHPAHERVGYVHPAMGLRVRTALAAAARARGCTTPLDGEIRACRDRLAELDIADVPTIRERATLADASTETERLKEEVAETRGELAVRREADDGAEAVAEQFRDAARELSEAETTLTAARQSLRRRRREARAARDRLERRFALEDDLANLRREARKRLVSQVERAYESAVAATPGRPSEGDPFDVDTVTAALAVARVAGFDAPVVLACERFETARAASAWLDAPVVRVPRP